MIRTLIALFILALAAFPAHAQDLDRTTDPVWLDSLYHSGIEFGQFLDEADARRERWVRNYGEGELRNDLLDRVDAVQGQWHLLAVAIAGCSDSVSTIPYLAHLVGYSDRISMRVVHSDHGRPIMEAHRTPDGRAATPTVLVLNDAFEPVGVFVERPAELQAWAQGEGSDLSSREFVQAKYAWYDADAGKQTIGTILDIIENASK